MIRCFGFGLKKQKLSFRECEQQANIGGRVMRMSVLLSPTRTSRKNRRQIKVAPPGYEKMG